MTPHARPAPPWRTCCGWSTRPCAGSFMHFVLAFVIIFSLALGIGIENDNTTQLGSVSKCVAANTTDLLHGTCTASDKPSPAKLAGLRAGDKITAFNGTPVSTF